MPDDRVPTRAVFHGARFHTISGLCYDPHMTVAFEDRTAAGEARLSDDFVFSQSSLQAYVDCKRRFWLTYLNRVPWPAPPASPAGEYEQLMRQGADFHRAVQRSEEGVTGDSPATNLEYPLESWLASYRDHRPGDLPASHHEVERVLETPLVVDAGARRLMAKYDLIAADTERTVIIDWKTGSRAGRPAILQQKMQSSVYPYVLVEASHALPWGPVRPEQVEMRYWFTAACRKARDIPIRRVLNMSQPTPGSPSWSNRPYPATTWVRFPKWRTRPSPANMCAATATIAASATAA